MRLLMVCSIVVVAILLVPAAEGATKNTSISIELSPICLKLIKANITDSCPTYGYLKKYDTTNPKYSGKFVIKDGIDQREKPPVKAHLLFYKNKNMTIVDPDHYTKERTKLIIIEGKSLAYKSNTDRYITNNTFVSYEGRYVEKCDVAHIKWDERLLLDTIRYLQSDCTLTEYDIKIVKKNPYSKLTYDGLHYKYLKMIEDAKKLKGINCLKSSLC